jgi:phage tail sheath gpL-like
MSISDAVGLDFVTRITGYKITKGNFQQVTPNLPQRIAIIGEANAANQSGLSTDAIEVTNAQQAGTLFGFGSPIHLAMRILRPVTGGGVGAIPTVVYPQEEAAGATSKIVELTPVGVATGNGTHTLVIAGRKGVDGERYDITINTGDTVADINAKIVDAISAVLGSPVIATTDTYLTTLETKWKGLTANELSVSVDNNGASLGITYAVQIDQAGSGTPSVSASLAMFGNEWNTIVVNTYGTVSAVMEALETFNGVPDPTTPTGRYLSTVFKPFIAITGSVADNPSAITDPRLEQVTIAIAPAPLSLGFSFEAAANMTVLFAVQAQNAPNLDVAGRSYPDMPTPSDIGTMKDVIVRNSYVKKGCSTVDLVSGRYQVQDFVTTYHPVGEIPAQYAYCRNLNIDWNVYFGYYLLELINVVDHSIANDNDIVSASKVVKPKQWKGVLNQYADSLALRALIADPAFMQDSLRVGLSTTNPDRLETFFKYKRTGFVRVASTTVEAGFNFGTI